MKPILFNTDMVRALLEGRKTVTRRVAFPSKELNPFPRKDSPDGWWFRGQAYRTWENVLREPQGVLSLCKYRTGDILYVRETCALVHDETGKALVRWGYKADNESAPAEGWTPSIHMPKEAARLFLRVTDVRVERLQEIDDEGVLAEGLEIGRPFDELWDSTIKKADRSKFGWDANPWVWVIAFERVSREEVQ